MLRRMRLNERAPCLRSTLRSAGAPQTCETRRCDGCQPGSRNEGLSERLRWMSWGYPTSTRSVWGLILSAGASIHRGHARHAGESEFLHYSAWNTSERDACMAQHSEGRGDVAGDHIPESHG